MAYPIWQSGTGTLERSLAPVTDRVALVSAWASHGILGCLAVPPVALAISLGTDPGSLPPCSPLDFS